LSGRAPPRPRRTAAYVRATPGERARRPPRRRRDGRGGRPCPGRGRATIAERRPLAPRRRPPPSWGAPFPVDSGRPGAGAVPHAAQGRALDHRHTTPCPRLAVPTEGATLGRCMCGLFSTPHRVAARVLFFSPWIGGGPESGTSGATPFYVGSFLRSDQTHGQIQRLYLSSPSRSNI